MVTAAHCLKDYDDSRLYLAFGTKAQPGAFTESKLRAATKIRVHEGFSFAGISQDVRPVYDIALVELNAPAPSGYEPVAVMGPENTVDVGEELVLAGFGATSTWWFLSESGELRKVSTKLAGVNGDMKEFDFGPTRGRTSCNGDSGGPAFVKRGDGLALLGVTSRGDYCQSEGTYTDIRQFVGWLVESINLFDEQAAE